MCVLCILLNDEKMTANNILFELCVWLSYVCDLVVHSFTWTTSFRQKLMNWMDVSVLCVHNIVTLQALLAKLIRC